MKRLTLSLFIFYFFCTANLFSQQVIKILAIGNSFSIDAVEFYLNDIASADGVELIIGNMHIGGCSLETHWKNAHDNLSVYSYRKIVSGNKTITKNKDLISAIKEENWDYITFQQASHKSGIYNSYFPYLTNLKEFVQRNATNSKVKFAFQQTWAYATNSTHAEFPTYNNNQITMYKAVVRTVKKVCSEVGIGIIIPTGTAIQNVRSSSVGDNLCRDGYHLNLGIGRYTAACVWYEKLLKRNVVGNSFIPKDMTQKEVNIAQRAAHFAVLKPNKVSSMVSF
jgi:hypothetical protein